MTEGNIRLTLDNPRLSLGAPCRFRNTNSLTTKTMWEACHHTFLDIGHQVTEKPEFGSTSGFSCLYIMGSTT